MDRLKHDASQAWRTASCFMHEPAQSMRQPVGPVSTAALGALLFPPVAGKLRPAPKWCVTSWRRRAEGSFKSTSPSLMTAVSRIVAVTMKESCLFLEAASGACSFHPESWDVTLKV